MPLGFRILKEDWQRKEVSLAHINVFGCDSYVKVKDVANDKLDAKAMKCTFIGYSSDEMGYRFYDMKGHKVVRSTNITFNKDSLYGSKAATDFSNLTGPNQKGQVVLEYCLDNLANDSIVAEHGLSSKITQSSDEEGFDYGASFKDGGSGPPHVQRSSKESRASVRGQGFDMAEIKKLKRLLSQEFEIEDLGSTEHILGMRIIKYKMKDTDHEIGVVSRFMSNPSKEHWKAVKWLLRYLKELVSEWTLSLMKILGAKNPADMLIKVVTTEKLKLCAASIGFRDN
ncbi:retrovirus-related pol polyprotein from transposon TNT 1-94 [Tanacetum coccineum]